VPIELTEQAVVALLLVAALVAIAVSRLRLPYTVALTLVGLFLGFGGVFTELRLTPALILLAFLPPLLFEGAINMDLDDLRRRAGQVGTLAFGGTVVATVVLVGGFLLIGFAPSEAFVLAVVLAPTDPVSVLAIFKEHGVGVGLRTLLEGESIFNDALAIVLFLIAVEFAFPAAGAAPPGLREGIFEFGTEVGIGVGTGLVVGYVAHRLMGTLDDHLVEATLSLVTAFGSYLVADGLGGSGVIATVAAGLLIGNYGTSFAMSASSRLALDQFWEVVAFLVNSVLFLLIGLQFDVAALADTTTAVTVVVAIVAMLLGRAVISFGLLTPFVRSSRGLRVPSQWRPAVFWGGLRGSIPIALALSLPTREIGGTDVPAVVFGVVLFSLLVQGLTFGPLLRRLGLSALDPGQREYEEAVATSLVLRASLDELDGMRQRAEVSPEAHEAFTANVSEQLGEVSQQIRALSRDLNSVRGARRQRIARRLAAAQKLALAEAGRRGALSDETVRDYSRRIDIALAEGTTAPSIAADLEPSLFARDEDGDEDGDGEPDDEALADDEDS